MFNPFRWREKQQQLPTTASAEAMLLLNDARRIWLEQQDCLDWLNVETLRRCWRDTLQGGWAEQQWFWEQLERTDARLITSGANRDASLSEYDLVPECLPNLSDADQALAESQCRTVQDLVSCITNLPEAIIELGHASRRHYTMLQPVEDTHGLRLENIPRWLICRDGYRGAWRYNPQALAGTPKGVDFPVPFEHLIFRCCPVPLLLSAQNLVLDRKSALVQWDSLLKTYGTPPLFLVMPDGLSEADFSFYVEAARQCVSNAKGVLPNGSDIKTAVAPATSADLFAQRIALANEELTMLLLGSTLTQTAEAGSGTLAGNAHADTSDRLAAGEAKDIARVLNDSLARSILGQYHGGQRVLCRLVMRRDATPTVAEEVTNLATLRSAGYSVEATQASQRTGWELKEMPPTPSLYESKAVGYRPTQAGMEQMTGLPMETAPAEVMAPNVAYASSQMNTAESLRMEYHSNRSLIEYAPAREQYEKVMHSKIEQADVMEEALALKQQLDRGLDPEQIAADAQLAESALNEALNILTTDSTNED